MCGHNVTNEFVYDECMALRFKILPQAKRARYAAQQLGSD
jgi:hypothetical protein